MFSDPFLVIVVLACFVVLGILLVGIGGFAKGGAFNRKHANRIMRWRIGAQAVAVVLILAYIAFRNAGG